MSSLLSVLVSKDPASSVVTIYQANPKTVQAYLNTHDRGCNAFIETICDLDEAHFLTKWEIQKLSEHLMGVQYNSPPRDRLVAAKTLAQALLLKQKELPSIETVMTTFASSFAQPTRVCLAQGNITPCKRGTKLAMLLGLLEKGSTLGEMMIATGWTEGGVLSGLNWDLNKRKGFQYRVTGTRPNEVYSLVIPQDYTGPLYKD